MNRRTFITGTVSLLSITSLAGCTSKISQDGLKTDSMDSIKPLEYSITLTSRMSKDKPPSAQVEIKNSGDKEITLGDSRDLFKFNSGVYRTEVVNISELEYSETGWYKKQRTARTTDFQTITLQPGQSESRTVYFVMTQQDFPKDAIEFPQKFTSVVTTQTELNDFESGENLNWGFTLTEDVLLPKEE